jgi:mono/diheme cytochrome c family protein
VSATTLAAGGLACAGAAMTIAAFAGGGDAAPAPTAPAHTANRGAQVFVEQGCGSCHTFAPANARGGIGPDLALSLRGESKDFVLRSIVAPDDDVPQGWSADTMPDDFARRIAPRDLDPLVAYLMKGAAG